MIPLTVADLVKGDIIRFTENARIESVVEKTGPSAMEGLTCLDFANGGRVSVPTTADVYGVTVRRSFVVHCLLCQTPHEIIYDIATGAPPLALVCDGCGSGSRRELLERLRETPV
jgi:hypothetical protein